MTITVQDMQHEDIAVGAALREDWRPILLSWMAECTEPDRFRRLHTTLQRCLHDGEHLIEAAIVEGVAGRFPRNF